MRVLLILFCASSMVQGAVDWAEVMGPAQGTPPPPAFGEVTWRENLVDAMKEAKAVNLPVFLTMRCLPCKQCADFDKDVLEGGPELTPLLRQFVTVRITDASNMDLRWLRPADYQDLDLSWWGYFLSPDGRLYAIFGGKDHVSESTRISEKALVNTMRRVLSHHYDPRREQWNIDGPPAPTGPAATPRQLPGYASWRARQHPGASAECLHCHQVVEIMRQPAIDQKLFSKARDLQMWPLPENVGIELDRDHGLKVLKVASDSAAAKAGILPGDELAVAGDRRLFGQADFRGVLHRGPQGDGKIDVRWTRDDKPMSGTLALKQGWRVTPLGWRMSVSQGNIGAAPGFWPLKGGGSSGQMAVKPLIPKNDPSNPAVKAGLSKDHTIVAVNGQSPPLDGRELMTWFRLNFNPGDKITLTVREKDGRTRQLTYPAPASNR